MKKKIPLMTAGFTGIGALLMTLPISSAAISGQEPAEHCRRVRVESLPDVVDFQQVQRDDEPVLVEPFVIPDTSNIEMALADVEPLTESALQQVTILDGEEGPSWLGVETQEVSGETVKEFKLPVERGVLVGAVTPDSPAAKAGLKEKDVITEVNGQRVEGAAQFRRMIREIPAGRTVQLTVWRGGRTQTLSATLGKAEELHQRWMKAAPGGFTFRMPDVEIPNALELRDLGDQLAVLGGGHPRLGIDGEDVSGQLGSFFGAPDGEGILVRSVNSGSPAEKAGLKAGDVIVSFNGERVHSLGDLREKMAGQTESQAAKVGVLRNHSEMTLNVELPARTPKVKEKTIHRRSI